MSRPTFAERACGHPWLAGLLALLVALLSAAVGSASAAAVSAPPATASAWAAAVSAPPATAAIYAYDSPASFTDWNARSRPPALRVTEPIRAGSPRGHETSADSRDSGVAAETEAGVGNALVKSELPANRGFLGDPVETTLKTGTRIDRFGGPGGTFASPEGTPFAARSLRSTSINSPYNVYEVAKPVTVQGGTVAPAFGYGGGGIQYEFGSPIQDLIDSGILKRVGP